MRVRRRKKRKWAAHTGQPIEGVSAFEHQAADSMGCWLRGSPRKRISICTIEETNVTVIAAIAVTSPLD